MDVSTVPVQPARLISEGMTNETIGVGIIGAGPGWATDAHFPALGALPSYRVVALSTTKQASADAAARRWGVPHAFDHHEPLITHPDVELVVVSVQARQHGPLVRAAIAAGKHVLCEWPVGPTLAETTELAALARARGVVAVTTLQRRFAPAVRGLRTLLDEGFVGTLRSVTVHVALPILGARRSAAWASTADITTGANTLHSVTPHMLDPLVAVVGEPTSFSALVARQFDQTTLEETGEVIPVTAPDQAAVIGTLSGGAILSVRVEAGKRSGGGVTWTFTGTEGDIELRSDFSLHGARGDHQPLAPLPAAEPWLPRGELSGDAHEIAHVYLGLAPALRGGALDPLVRTLDDAVHIRQLMEAFLEASTTGRRISWR